MKKKSSFVLNSATVCKHPSRFFRGPEEGPKKSETVSIRLYIDAPLNSSEMLTYQNTEASSATDKWFSFVEGVSEVYALVDNKEVGILPLASFEQAKTVSLGLRVGTAGEHTFRASTLGLAKGTQAYLEDKVSGTWTDLSVDSYTFTANAGDFTERFVLHAIENNLAQIYSNASVIYINLAYAEESTISVFDLSGRKVKELQTSAQSTQITDLQEGTYIVRVNSAKGVKTEKVFVK